MPVYFFDLWMTLIHSLPNDPIISLHERLAGDGAKVSRDAFLQACLTTNIADAETFLRHVGTQFDIAIDDEHHYWFQELLERERQGVTFYPETLSVLTSLKKRGAHLGVISNLWPFPAQHIFERHGLGEYFDDLIFSFEVGSRKPDSGIFDEACRRFGVSAADCLMIGDGLGSDIQGAVQVNMPAAFINRSGQSVTVAAGVREIRSLTELL